ncbi:hypothetical protein AB0C38_11625 [Amycolatopsis sp. NPDC048633]|uniref:hypothetical protein n=1 Tax=Amycolatopsis sp. NPDC048633 TaxID=3157095 RepID=UPI0033F717E5
MAEGSRTELIERLVRDRAVRGEPRRLDEVIALARQDVADAPAEEGSRRWSNLGAALWARWEGTADLDALRECLDASRRAFDAEPPGYVRDCMRLNLVHVLFQLGNRGIGPETVDEALGHVIDLIPEPGEAGDPRTVTVAEKVLALCRALPGPPRPRYAEARRRFVIAYADLSLTSGRMLVNMAAESHDLETLEEGTRLLDDALEAPTEDVSTQVERRHARAVASAIRWQIAREPVDLDNAITGFLAAVSLGEQIGDIPPSLVDSLALSYSHRYERDGAAEDLSAAIAVLAAAASVDGDAGRDRQARMQRYRWERYEATADLADLEAAVDLGRQLVADGREANGLSREDHLSNLVIFLTVRQLYRYDAGVSAEIAKLAAALGESELPSVLIRPLPWVRTYEEGGAGVPASPSQARRVLFLHTFKDPAADVVVLRHLAAALGPHDRIAILSDTGDEATLAAAAGDRVEVKATSSADWTRVVHEEMVLADAVVLHLSPKDLVFPRVSAPKDLSAEFPRDLWEIGPDTGPAHQARVMAALSRFERGRGDSYAATPLGSIPTGASLLRELAFLSRLDRLSQTVVVADNRHYYHLMQRIENAMISVADTMTIDERYRTPRLTALERQLEVLDEEVRGITFSARPDGGLSPAFTAALATALAGVDPITGRESTLTDVPIGVSPNPRRLPPDNQLKVVSATPVEDLLYIPPGTFVEISQADARHYFDDEVVAEGCPRCGGPFDRVFFYTTGLEHPGLDRLADAESHGKCQTCGRRSTVLGPDGLAPF